MDLADITERTIRDISTLASERGVALNLHEGAEQVIVNAAPNSFEQILINFVNNAVKFSESGDTVTVHTYAAGNLAQLAISNQGIDMTPEQIEEASVPFKRFTDRPGSGLGLSIVKQLVAANDGKMTITSELGKGTTVVISLPLAYG